MDQQDPVIDLEPATIDYRPEFGLHWPSTENDRVYTHMLNRVTDIDVAVRLCRTHGVAVQAGGFIGMWPIRLTKFFERIYTFEPIYHLYECLRLNTEGYPAVISTRAALGREVSELGIDYKRGGCTRIVSRGRGKTPAVSIDSLNLIRCDAIFLDVERHEMEVLEGALMTLQSFHPVVTLEIKADTAPVYDKYMDKLGYSKVAKVHADVIYKWGK